MTRITEKHLAALIERLNKLTGNPTTYCDKSDKGITKIHVGHYHLDCAYSGYKLCQTDNDSGGVRDISRSGYTTKRALYSEIQMIITGIEIANERKSV